MAKTKLVIELGSSNTVIYQVGYGIVLREPSVILTKEGKLLEVGLKAKKMIGKTETAFKVVEPIKNGQIVDEKSAILMLKAFLNKVVEGKTKIDATFVVSIGLTDNDLLMFRSVAYGCNISNVKFVNTCLSGLIGAGVSADKTSAVACVNLGGGTSNFAVISLGKLIEGFSVTFGGIDMDKAIVKYVKDNKNIDISLSMAEKVKNECGSLFLQDTTNMEIIGVDFDTKRPVTEIISSAEVREAIISFFENIKSGIDHLLSGCTNDVIADISLNGIVIIGGVANFTGLENFLTKKLGIPVLIPDTPENYSVLGANNI